MNTKDIIRYYASLQPNQRFTRKEIMIWVKDMKLYNNGSATALSLAINRMIQSGELTKESWGTYSIVAQNKRLFIPAPTEEIRAISKNIKAEHPYTNFCIWNPQVIVPFMHHIPNLQMLIVEIERVALEPAFNLLQEKEPNRRIVFNPSHDDYSHYVLGNPSIIVKPLVSQAPLIDFGGIKLPTIEKIMVDIYGDVDFAYAQGAELFTIYDNILSSYQVNYKALYRYADRRGRRNQVEHIINSLKNDFKRKQESGMDSGIEKPLHIYKSDTY